jgi:hypothetical protein
MLVGRAAVLGDYPLAPPALNAFYAESLDVLRKIRLARVGNTSVSRDNRKPPR